MFGNQFYYTTKTGAVLPVHLVLLVIVALWASEPVDAGEVLFQDDFDVFDPNKWEVLTQYRGSNDPNYPGTQTRDKANFGPVDITQESTIKLPLELYNPTADPNNPGDSFYGTDIYSKMLFEPGVSIEARLRLVKDPNDPIPNGIVGAFFLFETESLAEMSGIWDEADFELLSNDLNNVNGRQGVLTNVFNDFSGDPNVPGNPDDPNFLPLVTNISDFQIYRIAWHSNVVVWTVTDENGARSQRTEIGTVPDEPMHIHLNIHVPGPGFSDAHDPNLLPVDTPEENKVYYLEVDYVVATALDADFDKDGDVDNADLAQWEGDYGGPGSDADGDGDSDGLDFLIWQRQFTGDLFPPLSASTTVPEPSSAALLLCLATVKGLCRRRSCAIQNGSVTHVPNFPL